MRYMMGAWSLVILTGCAPPPEPRACPFEPGTYTGRIACVMTMQDVVTGAVDVQTLEDLRTLTIREDGCPDLQVGDTDTVEVGGIEMTVVTTDVQASPNGVVESFDFVVSLDLGDDIVADFSGAGQATIVAEPDGTIFYFSDVYAATDPDSPVGFVTVTFEQAGTYSL